ncbi:hypothetical protein H2O64_04520 [Kordia sp. YSTF-M3]|uniref:Uncharacterized protein n=1 Tax=Kordia aestuariivivens TaxID=2759037 RepID=A0ABR7Q5X1_9FLAO|nr:hypothetical protein [Kordia aestuariivivens]MBC8753922.1 hypothetical protein [Kordia aestuariivivens]
MKQKIMNYLRFGILVFGISVLLFNCQTDNTDELINTPKGENSFLKKGKLENYEQLSTYVEKLKNPRTSTNDVEKSSLEDTNGFDILYDQDMFIQEVDSFVTYSIPIYKKNQLGGTFSNLVVRFSDTEPTEALILNYYPNNEYLDAVALDDRTPFAGSISSELIDYDGSLDTLKNNKSNALDCVIVTTKYCDYEEGRHGTVHLGGDNCTPGYYWFVTTTVCYDDEPSLADIPSPGSGNPSATDYIDYTTAGGGISSGSTVHPPIVVPTVPRTHTGLNIDGLTLEMTEWLNNNPEIKQELENFLEENNWSTEAKEEVKLTIQAESIKESDWDFTRTGMFNGQQALTYVAAYDGFDTGSYTMYKLANGHILCESTIRRKINPEDGNTIGTQDDPLTNFYYVKIKHTEGASDNDDETVKDRWYNYKMPPNTNNADCIYCGLEYLFQTALENSLVFAGRYVVPFEDAIIVITGEDFYGVESSRAVSGTLLVIEVVGVTKIYKLIKAIKYVDDVADVALAVYRYMDDIFKTQKRYVEDVLNNIIDLNEFGNTIRKGNYGEMYTDVELTSLGYEPLHIRVTDIDQPLNQGIDGVFKNPKTGEYLIVESKYNTSTLGNTLDGKQMSDGWIQGTTTGNSRLVAEVGEELAQDIIASGYQRVVSRILPDGTNYFELLDSAGNIIEIWFP